MSRLNVFENIKVDDVISISLEASEITGEPMICVETNSEGEIQQKITEGFQIHMVNEFLRSLNLMPAELITFETYPLYVVLVSLCNIYLNIRKVMEAVSGVKYDEVNIYACQIYDCILNRLLAKHHMASNSFYAAMQKRPITEWVQEAITYFR